jgi:hypothetical protein
VGLAGSTATLASHDVVGEMKEGVTIVALIIWVGLVVFLLYRVIIRP